MAKKNLKLIAALMGSLSLVACSSTPDSEGGSSANGGSGSGGAGSVESGGAGSVELGGAMGGVNEYAGGGEVDPMLVDVRVVYFDFDMFGVRADAVEVLRAHAANLNASGQKIVLAGHTDSRGTREYNLALGEKRAKAVSSFLQQAGVQSSQIEVVSYGEEQPVDESESEAAYAENRRVEILYQ
jgi:peptidoglycan-associated lipoprotein